MNIKFSVQKYLLGGMLMFFTSINAKSETLSCSALFSIKNHQTKASPSNKSKIFKPKNNLKNYVKYLQNKLQEFDHALEQELTYRIEEDQNFTLRKISNWFDLKEVTEKYGYDVRIVSLEIDFKNHQSFLVLKSKNGSDLFNQTASDKLHNYIEKKYQERHKAVLSDALGEAESLTNYSPAELKTLLNDSIDHIRFSVKKLASDFKFFHVTKNRETLDIILENGMDTGTGDMSSAVYAVTYENIQNLRRWATRTHWSSSPRSLVVEILVKQNAVVIDIQSAEGKKSFDAFRLLHLELKNSEEIRTAFLKFMKGDILLYFWESAQMNAVAIKNTNVIKDVYKYEFPR